MRWLGATAVIGALALMASARPAAAQEQQKPLEFTVTVTGHVGVVKGSPSDHFLSFSGPIEIPGVGLKPGTYIFQQVRDSTGLVRVLSSDHKTVYATFFATPVLRMSPGETQVTFARTTNGAPVRIASWFQEGRLYGMAPLYPSASAARSAATGD